PRVILAMARSKPLGAFGAAVILLVLLVAIAAPLIAPYDPLAMNFDAPFAPPSARFLVGADEFGRDVLSRIIWGSRISLYVGVVSVVLGQSIGGALGVVSGFMGGRVDVLVQRFVDMLMSFPMLVLALSIVAALGPSPINVVLAISIVQVPRSSRIIRSAALLVKEMQYVDAGRAIGASGARILWRHVLPNCVAPFIVIASTTMGLAILTEASLSFLGVGTPPPDPSWGAMLSGTGRSYVEIAPWLAIFPGLALTLTVFGFNLLGDALRDILDPRLRK
ncbi:MAG: ABC transporter permease, partial [Chloroflexota bacterium]